MDEFVLKEKGKEIYDINAVDGKTGYNLSHLLTDTLSLPHFRKFFRELKGRVYDQCKERYERYRETGRDEGLYLLATREGITRMVSTSIPQGCVNSFMCSNSL
ncbi:MAG: hypothetical protein DRN12_07615 [Thermoplasmata archaeon]|nr:MAG: hypothetical protein DRN12_07615 [Thermoplasmata archaeon]